MSGAFREIRVERRGAAAVATIILLMLMNLIIVGMIIGGARESDLTVRRLETVQAFYAAEGGMNMALRELMENADEDGDGVVGSISDDADDGNNPTLGSATLVVTLAEDSGETTVTSEGAAGLSQRQLEVILTGASSGSSAGLGVSYFALGSSPSSLNSVDWDLAPTATAVVMDINWPRTSDSTPFWSGGPNTNYGAQFEGDIETPTTGTWTFYTESDDGSKLWVDGMEVVNNDGLHAMRERSGTITLAAGTHEFRVRFFERAGNHGLIVRWRGPGGTPAKETIPASAFTH